MRKLLQEADILSTGPIENWSSEAFNRVHDYTGKRVRMYLFGQMSVYIMMDGQFEISAGALKILGDDRNTHIMLKTDKAKNMEVKITDGHLVIEGTLPEGAFTVDLDYWGGKR